MIVPRQTKSSGDFLVLRRKGQATAIVKLSELRPIVFARLVGEVSELIMQGGELGKPARSGKTAG